MPLIILLAALKLIAVNWSGSDISHSVRPRPITSKKQMMVSGIKPGRVFFFIYSMTIYRQLLGEVVSIFPQEMRGISLFKDCLEI
ncbi:hypothetical protein A9Q84_00945 [Halobacteriovorax marinus]|uniref:Uncharacterized protein n=1 Tax=Halobacteriovorax marinus TaxID=97084 RepID=A0A1Y5FBX3_9BACT|nr:hypothetical protein A9Q84_00945 [Halobacteriovorax marinus]